ncbi:hypothetical protein GO495_06570 [Chitinophaga oryziterrae]|uniref:Uncharacterized protein n=1 Tax=Chitinophaga oryziterrae TaxID=1031224 RepID=A0A6N8J6J9_9BACT|nr:hypothetical protein [Chitinophaga oryziterrae]MVT40238.1 hypothetical protein [Chitinophaga oryziterrae]
MENQKHQLLDQISTFIFQEILKNRGPENKLEILYQTLQLAGTVQDKLDWLNTQLIPPSKRTAFEQLQQQPLHECLKDPLFTNHFNQSLNKNIQFIQNEIPTLKNGQEQQEFVEKQKRQTLNRYTFYRDQTITTTDKKTLTHYLQKLYKLVHTQYYLQQDKITDQYIGFDPLQYTVLDKEQAQKLYLHTQLIEMANHYNLTHSHSYLGIKPVLDQVTTIFKQLLNAKQQSIEALNISLQPYEHFPKFGQQLASLNLPPTHGNKITNQFIAAIHGLQHWFIKNNEQEIPVQTEFTILNFNIYRS